MTRGNDPSATAPEDPGALKVFKYNDGELSDCVSIAPNGGYGFGPRHIDFHPGKPFAYVINELDSTITTYRKSGPVLAPLQTTPSCPDTFTGYSTGAEIWVGRDGRHVYVTNRGHDSIAVFAIDAATGKLTLVEIVPTGGKVIARIAPLLGLEPRFDLPPSDRLILAASRGTQ